MEEILASIRRIIEDSDTVKKPSAFDRASPAQPVVDDLDEPLLEPANSDVVSFLRPADVDEPETSEPGEPASAFASDPIDEPETTEAPADPLPQGSPFHDDAEAFDLPDDFAAEFEELQAALEHEAQAMEEPVAPAHVPEQPSATRSSLVSENTGRQVAASFGELTDAFAASRRKSFDEMAEDMLRPMLQEWLDDNLPTLVERLVREEIERVARGGSR
jgi:cell pole-organizing protein PopZ